MRILIGADVVPTAPNMEAFTSGDIHGLVDLGLEKLLTEADYRVFNLEVPLTNRADPIPKCGPNLIAPTAAAAGIKALGADLLTLANNHILDQGEAGLRSTIEVLNQWGIPFAGAGETPEDAAKPYILEREGMKIGFYCCAEHEFSIVTEHTPGANPFDPLWSLDHIQALKEQCDYVIVLYHGGKELYRYPSPNLQKVCRRIAEKGADLVVCQHSHCIGCREVWKGSTIVYGQGNFLFSKSKSEFWKTSLLICVELSREKREVSFIPLEKQNDAVGLAARERGEEIRSQFLRRSEEILEPGFVTETYERYAEKSILEYYGRCLGRTRYILFRLANKLCGDRLRGKCYSQKDSLALENLLLCEAHRELYASALNRAYPRKRKK